MFGDRRLRRLASAGQERQRRNLVLGAGPDGRLIGGAIALRGVARAATGGAKPRFTEKKHIF